MASHAVPVTWENGSAIPVRTRVSAQVRLAFLDNLRILLVVLVVLQHLALTYGAEGPWQYKEGSADTMTTVVLTLFVAVNQAFFMGFYFLIAAYFVPRSLESKGTLRFLKDRFVRLGVPLALQLLVVGPLISYGLGATIWGFEGSFWAYTSAYWRGYHQLDIGPLWFVEALLFFNLAYALWWTLARPSARIVRRDGRAPGNWAAVTFALVVALVTFVVRTWLPVGSYFAPLGFQFPHFPQYVGLFVAGTIAYRRGWLSSFFEDAARGRTWSRVAGLLVVAAPVLFVAGGALGGSTEPFRGGLHWQALAYALWEQFLCVAVVISLLSWFRRRHDRQGRLAREMSASAYAAYLIHAAVLLSVAVVLRSVALHPLLKFGLAALISLPICFTVAGLVRRLPVAHRFL